MDPQHSSIHHHHHPRLHLHPQINMDTGPCTCLVRPWTWVIRLHFTPTPDSQLPYFNTSLGLDTSYSFTSLWESWSRWDLPCSWVLLLCCYWHTDFEKVRWARHHLQRSQMRALCSHGVQVMERWFLPSHWYLSSTALLTPSVSWILSGYFSPSGLFI